MEGKLLKHKVFNKRYKRLFTVGDGSCLFHSLCRIFDLEDYTTKTWKERVKIGHRFRKLVVDPVLYCTWLREKGFEDLPGILTYEEAVDPHTMAEECLINFAAWRLDLTLYLVKNPNEVYVRFGKDRKAGACILAHIDAVHFEPIVPIDHYSPFDLPSDIDMAIGENCCVLPPDMPLFSKLSAIE